MILLNFPSQQNRIMEIPTLLLKQLYNFGSLKNLEHGLTFSVKNRLSDAVVVGINSLTISGEQIPLDKIKLKLAAELSMLASEVSEENRIGFPLKKVIDIEVEGKRLSEGRHEIELSIVSEPFGELNIAVAGGFSESKPTEIKIPRDNTDDYNPEIIKERQAFVEEYSDTKLEHLKHYSFDPHMLEGNCEHFSGVAQIPIGFAGPIKIDGEYARDEFMIPLATTEGTLVASYNRGIKVINECGGAVCTIVDDAMQRAPVFVFNDARESRDFVRWVQSKLLEIKEVAEATSSVARLQYIDPYLSNKFAYLRFNYSTGDAAGQNMVGRATFAACSWIIDNYKKDKIKNFYLESNLATDKKASQVNIMRTRGKRVTAEVTIPKEVLERIMRVDPKALNYHYGIANIGAFLSGANNNGLHSANAITAMFIATGQDVANVSESSAGILYTELTSEGGLYISITIPSLIVATYGGGTGLATQAECLSVLGCVGKDKVNKFAEIVAGVVLAGEISLASAISSSDWVSSHEQYGRNR